MLKFLAGALLGLAIAFPCVAQEADPGFMCIPETDFAANMAAVRGQPGVRVGVFNADETKAFLAALNAMEPATDWTGDSIVFAIIPNGNVSFVIMKAGRACIAKEVIPAALFRKLLETIIGAPA